MADVESKSIPHELPSSHWSKRIRVVSPVGRFTGSFRPGSFRPCFKGGSIRPYYVSRFGRRLFRPWVVSPIVFIEGHTDS